MRFRLLYRLKKGGRVHTFDVECESPLEVRERAGWAIGREVKPSMVIQMLVHSTVKGRKVWKKC